MHTQLAFAENKSSRLYRIISYVCYMGIPAVLSGLQNVDPSIESQSNSVINVLGHTNTKGS